MPKKATSTFAQTPMFTSPFHRYNTWEGKKKSKSKVTSFDLVGKGSCFTWTISKMFTVHTLCTSHGTLHQSINKVQHNILHFTLHQDLQ